MAFITFFFLSKVSFRPLGLTQSASLHQTQFASHGLLANYISSANHSEFGPWHSGALIGLLFYHLQAVFCCYRIFLLIAARASRMRGSRFSFFVPEEFKIYPFVKMASFGAIPFRVKIAVPLENGKWKSCKGSERVSRILPLVFFFFFVYFFFVMQPASSEKTFLQFAWLAVSNCELTKPGRSLLCSVS